MSTIARVDWRRRVWTIYLGIGVLLTAAYLAVPPLKGSGPLINVLGLSSSVAVVCSRSSRVNGSRATSRSSTA